MHAARNPHPMINDGTGPYIPANILAAKGSLVNPWESSALKVQADAAQLLQNLIQTLNTNQLSTITAGLMGSQKSYPYEGLINGTSSLYADEPAPVPKKFHLMSQTSSDQHQGQGVIENSWASFEGYESSDISDFLISELVPESPETATTSMNQMGDDKTNTNHGSTVSPDSSIFQAWEKLMDDETDNSFWKDILDLASSPSSPIL
ncbi:hypothetical protein GOBAR_DD00327 [Gossypium barbadense]|nr:hypothetical protein GOBAR_DD00327 [Gossypium barbadense]